jgi:hypothetical protein
VVLESQFILKDEPEPVARKRFAKSAPSREVTSLGAEFGTGSQESGFAYPKGPPADQALTSFMSSREPQQNGP